MGLPPWEVSDSQLFALITGANSGLGFSFAARLIDELITSPTRSPAEHLILILCTRSPMKTRFTISRLRSHLRTLAVYSPYATSQREKAKAGGGIYKWEDTVQRVHFLGVEADLCDLHSVYALADKLVNGTVGSPDATTIDGQKLPHGSPGTSGFSEGVEQDRWALSQKPGSEGALRSWGWGLSGLTLPRIDVLILTAGIGGWIGVDWIGATKAMLTRPIEAMTWPNYKMSAKGVVVKSQLSSPPKSGDEAAQPLLPAQEKVDEPPLGEVFCANVFGHYILAHELMPLLSRPAIPTSKSGGKILWVSSIEAIEDYLNPDDIQSLQSPIAYEESKRLIDQLTLTAELPSLKHIVAPYFDPSNTITARKSKASAKGKKENVVKPHMYLTHPGIFISEIFPMPFVLVLIYRCLFYLVRWAGSPWHCITAEKAAAAPVWLSLTPNEELEEIEGKGLKKMKWGSGTRPNGEEKIMQTEVGEWGWDGEVGAVEGDRLLGRRRGAKALNKESREEFEVQGAEVWKKMEELRLQWEGILGFDDK